MLGAHLEQEIAYDAPGGRLADAVTGAEVAVLPAASPATAAQTLRRPAVWLGVSGIVRLAVVLGLLALLVGTRWERLMVAVVGFLAVRVVLTRRLGRPGGGHPAARVTVTRDGT